MAVTLRAMLPAEWDRWRVGSVERYAAEMVRTGAWASAGAEDRAGSLFQRLVPQGSGTPGHEFRMVVGETGEAVGSLWFAAEAEPGRGSAFLWDIEIEEGQRGRGYGRAAMEALEELAGSLGYGQLTLHVFGDNTVARSLYRSVGYQETDVTMRKRIGGR